MAFIGVLEVSQWDLETFQGTSGLSRGAFRSVLGVSGVFQGCSEVSQGILRALHYGALVVFIGVSGVYQ